MRLRIDGIYTVEALFVPVGAGVAARWGWGPLGRPIWGQTPYMTALLRDRATQGSPPPSRRHPRPYGDERHHRQKLFDTHSLVYTDTEHCAAISTVHEREPNSAYNTALCEDDVARRWWSLPMGNRLPISDGTQTAYYQLLFSGYPGSSYGPDVHDAVFLPILPLVGMGAEVRMGGDPCGRPCPPDTTRIVGDVEFHVRSSDWLAHQHSSDPRYNNVVLHVVLLCDDPQPTRRQDGHIIPVCCLGDLPPLPSLSTINTNISWPCQQILSAMSDEGRDKLLLRAGILRFEQKSVNYIEQIRHMECDVSCETPQRHIYDLCLLTALAEALGYGRNRAFFRAAGLYILGLTGELPEPMGRMPTPSPLDAQRLRVLRHLILAWQDLEENRGAWQGIHTILMSSTSLDEVLDTIRNLFIGFGLSLARTDILLCNVVFSFAHAAALLEHDDALAERALTLYLVHPGLSSNRITRMMSQHLHLQREPHSSCQQQGLHHIYQETCKEKRCSLCIAGRDIL